MARARGMIRDYAQDVRLIKSQSALFTFLGVVAVYFALPFALDDVWAGILATAGVLAIGGIGLNLLTGYTGLPSLGTAGFIAIGTFASSYLGRKEDAIPAGLGWPFWKYTLVAIAIGALVGFIVGLPALRLRGVYLSIATLALVYVTLYVLKSWETVSGGNSGTGMPIDVKIFGLNFGNGFGPDLSPTGDVLGRTFSRNHSLFYLVWAFVGLAALLCRNIIRSRPGRALQAVRDRDLAAAVVGVSLFRSKVGAFVISSAIATLAGVFFGLIAQYAVADDLTFGEGALNLSIKFLAVIVIGGIGTSYGPILGALVIATTGKVTGLIASALPFLFDESGGSGISKGNFEKLLYAVLIIVFLVTEPKGLAGILRRIGGYFRTWPLARST